MKQKGLGKGLGALISDAEEPVFDEAREFVEIDVNLIDVCKTQPRKNFDQERLTELADSIKMHGVIQPLILNKKANRYIIIAGERRYRAARLAGLTKVPAIIKDMEPREVLQVSIIENIQREDLNPIEEAAAFERLGREFGLTQDQIALRTGKPRSVITNYLRLLRMPDLVQECVLHGTLSFGHAKVLMTLETPQQMTAVAERVARDG
jgi:ParB family chromosome partitioning protein